MRQRTQEILVEPATSQATSFRRSPRTGPPLRCSPYSPQGGCPIGIGTESPALSGSAKFMGRHWCSSDSVTRFSRANLIRPVNGDIKFRADELYRTETNWSNSGHIVGLS